MIARAAFQFENIANKIEGHQH